MEPLKVRWIDRKGFFYDEFVTEARQPVMTRSFALQPAHEEGERSVELTFQQEAHEGVTVLYREVLT